MNLSNIYPSLENKVVLITGGASGIGANLVRAFSRQKAIVSFIDKNDTLAELLITSIGEQGDKCPKFYHCDLLDIKALQDTIAKIANDLGEIEVLINNAANDDRHDFKDVTVEYWDERLAVNLRHYFFASQAVYPGMKQKQWGSIINFGSMSWYATHGAMPGYTTSKAAIEGMTRGLARDMGADGIRVNTLVPGWVMTKRQLENSLKNEADKNRVKDAQCIKQFIIPENISAMALFLASDDSYMCTSQHYIVDGGII